MAQWTAHRCHDTMQFFALHLPDARVCLRPGGLPVGVGPLDAPVDGRGEPPRRCHEQVHVHERLCEHEGVQLSPLHGSMLRTDTAVHHTARRSSLTVTHASSAAGSRCAWASVSPAPSASQLCGCTSLLTLYFQFSNRAYSLPQSIEVTIQNLIGSGMDPKTENNPYLGFIYTSFQVLAAILALPAVP